jgi:hypothetical protein
MPNDSEVLLQELLSAEFQKEDQRAERAYAQAPVPIPVEDEAVKAPLDKISHTQWALGGNGKYSPVGATVPRLEAGIYECFASAGMWGVEKSVIASDGIYILPDMATGVILDEARQFWNSEARYREHNLLYKRGLLLWGPPGGGKTVAVKLLMNELVKQDGVVIIASSIPLLILCLKAIRRIEPTRRLIVVLEDLDEIIAINGEGMVLSMLDGENNVDNILHIATTNYPGRLGARIVNRPSRFDRRVRVGMPSAEARRAYLTKATAGKLELSSLDKWVEDTDNMSIAHLRELVAAAFCLEQPYAEVIERLQDMAKQPTEENDFARGSLGFKAATRTFNN